MDESKVEKSLGELSPKTQYAVFISIWHLVEDAMNRKISRSDIWKTCADAGLEVSYVTFTRMIKKKMAEDATGQIVRYAPRASAKMTSIPATPTAAETADKSESVATTSGRALEEVRAKNKGKDYSLVVRQQKK